MTFEQAVDICKRINARAFLAMGVTDNPVLPSLAGVSLRDMLTAAEMLTQHNASQRRGTGGREFYVVPVDRLIAAVFVGIHYAPSDTVIAIEPQQRLGEWVLNSVAVVDLSEQVELQDKGVAA
jgi:hypothetical protein